MLNDDIRRILNAQDSLAQQVKPIYSPIDITSGILSSLQWQQDIIDRLDSHRVFFGFIEDIRRSSNMTLVAEIQNQMSGLTKLMDVEQQFLTPVFSDVKKLLDDYSKLNPANLLTPYSQTLVDLQNAIESMRSPWLDAANQVQSLNGFARLHGIGSLLRSSPAFDAELTDALRIDLGDWREEVNWPQEIATDPLTRAWLYEQQGFNPDLTTFPYPAFNEIVTEAGLKEPEAAEAKDQILEEDSYEIVKEASFERTNIAHDRLQKFEYQLRDFISWRMRVRFGPEWIDLRIPEDMKTQWHERQSHDKGTVKWPLIAYADFTDYVTIITKRDNWRDLFKEIFPTKDSVQESFQRLYPIRLATMHARPITQNDEVYLYVETKRILSVVML